MYFKYPVNCNPFVCFLFPLQQCVKHQPCPYSTGRKSSWYAMWTWPQKGASSCVPCMLIEFSKITIHIQEIAGTMGSHVEVHLVSLPVVNIISLFKLCLVSSSPTACVSVFVASNAPVFPVSPTFTHLEILLLSTNRKCHMYFFQYSWAHPFYLPKQTLTNTSAR